MNTRRILIGTIVLGIVANGIDWLLNTYYWGTTWTSMAWVNPTLPITWAIVGDFCGALMLMLAWDKVGGSFGRGAQGGLKFGLAAGAFIGFPAVLFWQMYIKDFPYPLAWKLLIMGIIFNGVLGAVAGMLDGKQA